MATWVALLGSVNVGGSNKLAMKDLRRILADIGYDDVRTYIQSGNCVFESKETEAGKIGGAIASAIEKSAGFKPATYVFRDADISDILGENPFRDSDPKKVQIFFLAEPAVNADLDALEELAAESETFRLVDRVFFLHAPDGIGRSKLAAKFGKHLGVAMTARNANTVGEIAKMCEEKPTE